MKWFWSLGFPLIICSGLLGSSQMIIIDTDNFGGSKGHTGLFILCLVIGIFYMIMMALVNLIMFLFGDRIKSFFENIKGES